VHAGVSRLRLRIRGKLGKSRGSAIAHIPGLWLAVIEIIFIPPFRLVQRVQATYIGFLTAQRVLSSNAKRS
jgi:hypothetical protein